MQACISARRPATRPPSGVPPQTRCCGIGRGCPHVPGKVSPGRYARQRGGVRGGINDLTARNGMWRRFEGDDWAAFETLPVPVRRRLHEHGYDGWG